MNRLPTVFEELVDASRRGRQVFLDFLASVVIDDNVTLAALAAIKPVPGRRVFVTDATGGGVPCYGDGTDFRRYDNNAIVS